MAAYFFDHCTLSSKGVQSTAFRRKQRLLAALLTMRLKPHCQLKLVL